MRHLARVRAMCLTERILCFLCLALLPVMGARGAPALQPAVVKGIDALFGAFDRDGSPGYALGVVKEGRLVFARGYGRANLDGNIPITAQTSFHIGSLSMQFTAAAVALTILDGKLTLETPVVTYFPEVAHFHSDLRIKHLLYFTSGLPEYTALPRASGFPWFSYYYFTTDEAVGSTLGAPAMEFPPGTKWEYSEVNYILLSKVVEQAAKVPFSAFVRHRIFEPLGMRHSVVEDDPTLIIPNRATGYVDRASVDIRQRLDAFGIHIREGTGYAQILHVSAISGCSGIYSTLEDLALWNESFETSRLAGPAFTGQMRQRMHFSHGKDDDAFGSVFGSFGGHEMIWFSGGDLDCSAFMARLPDEHLAVICLSNMPTGDAESKAKQVLALVLGTGGP